MQALHSTSGVLWNSRSCQPPRSASSQPIRPRLLRSVKPLDQWSGQAVQRKGVTVARSTTAAEAEPATPLVSDNAAAEVPDAEVASQADLSAAMDKTQAGPNTDAKGQGQEKSSYKAGREKATGGRSAGKNNNRRPRTVGPDQLVPGKEFDGTVVSILAYGAFVDIGAATDGLVHISQLTNEYVPDPNQVVHNQQQVRVRIQSFDPSNNRLSLTMKLNDSSNGSQDGASNGKGQARQARQGKVARAGGGKKQDQKPFVKVGNSVTAQVRNMTGWAAWFDVGQGVHGMLHVSEMIWPEGAVAPTAYDCIKEGQDYQVRVLEVKGRTVKLTQKTEEMRQAEKKMEQKGLNAQSDKKASNTLEAALAQLGFKATPKEKGKKAKQQAVPAQAEAPAEAAPGEPPAGTDSQSTAELGKEQQEGALERQVNPKGAPTPLELPPEAEKAAQDAKSGAALEGEESGESGQGEPGTLDTSTSVEVTAPKETPSADPTDVAEGEEPPAVKAEQRTPSNSAALSKEQQDEALQRQINPKGEPTPVELPPEAKKAAETPPEEGAPLEGESPDQSGKTDEPGTADQSKGDTVEVTAPKEAEQAAPAEVAEGEESPLEQATNASASVAPVSAQASQVDDQSSAAALSGAEGADALPGTHSQAAPASPAGTPAPGSGESERTASPAAAPASTTDSANQAAAGTTSSSPGASGGSVSAIAVKEAGTVSAAAVKELRQETGAGMMDCKRALTEANGDIQKATEALRKKGLAAADKKAGRIAAEGLLAQYIHAGSRLGVIVEVNCETDFVARGDVFKQLANDMAMQIAACSQVTVVDSTQVPADVVEKERRVQLGKEDILKKPEQIRGKIVDGRIQKFLSEQSLLEQDFIKDTSKTVATVIKEATAAVGEKISIRRFERYQLGEGIEKKESDLGKDVEEQQAALQAKAAEKKEQDAPAPTPAPASAQIPDQPSVKVDAKLVKQLRDSSGAGMMDCKKALANNDNDLEKASEFLRKKGLAGADKKAGRVASEGAIASYVHAGSKLGVLIEVNCETDFVARGAKFKELVQDMAMQAAASPSALVVALQDVPEAEIEKERAIEMGKEDIQSKPEAIRPKIVEGRLNKIRSQKALLEQPFIKDTGSTVAEHIKAAVASLGENIQIRRFIRYNLGEGIQKKQDDFAAEVAAQTGQ